MRFVSPTCGSAFAWALVRIAQALVRSAHTMLRLKQQQLSFEDGNGFCSVEIPVGDLLLVSIHIDYMAAGSCGSTLYACT